MNDSGGKLFSLIFPNSCEFRMWGRWERGTKATIPIETEAGRQKETFKRIISQGFLRLNWRRGPFSENIYESRRRKKKRKLFQVFMNNLRMIPI